VRLPRVGVWRLRVVWVGVCPGGLWAVRGVRLLLSGAGRARRPTPAWLVRRV